MSIIDTVKNLKDAKDIDIAATVGSFETTLEAIAAATETAANAAVGALIAEHGTVQTEKYLDLAAQLRRDRE